MRKLLIFLAVVLGVGGALFWWSGRMVKKVVNTALEDLREGQTLDEVFAQIDASLAGPMYAKARELYKARIAEAWDLECKKAEVERQIVEERESNITDLRDHLNNFKAQAQG